MKQHLQASNVQKLGYDMPPLTVKGLRVFRGGRLVITGLNLSVSSGDIVFLRGANGCGKSTLLRTVAGLCPYNEGAINQADHEGQMLYQGHQNALKPNLTLAENLLHSVRVMTGNTLCNDTLSQLAAGFGLDAFLETPLSYFSSGQLHRAALLRFLAIPRALWLMDEPTVGLDFENCARLVKHMKAHLALGGAILVATHDNIGEFGNDNSRVVNMSDYAPTDSETHDTLPCVEDW